jgi:hypothetical protein
MEKKPPYKLHLEDIGGIIPYAKRNWSGNPYREIMTRAIPLTLYTIGFFAVPFIVWKGLEKLVKKVKE